jgi:carbon-monoxide dehydrogenase medium subunit/2-furoyl-CoA dehydrogenase FAD binding subunit
MKPAAFEYFAPRTVPECIELLARYGDEAKLIAGGQSLAPLMNFRLVQPEAVIDLNRIESLSYVRVDGDLLRIGAMTRQRDLEEDATVRELAPLLSEAIPNIGHFQIRNRGTIGGSLAHADPAAELPAVLLALGASLEIEGPSGTRTEAALDFFQGYLTTSLAPDEVLTEIVIPRAADREGCAVLEVNERHGDFALVGAVSRVVTDSASAITAALVGLFGVADRPVLFDVSERLGGSTGDRLVEVGEAVSASVTPDSDTHATAEYRSSVAGVLARRALASAYERSVAGA